MPKAFSLILPDEVVSVLDAEAQRETRSRVRQIEAILVERYQLQEYIKPEELARTILKNKPKKKAVPATA